MVAGVDIGDYSPTVLVASGVAGLILLVATAVIEIRIIVEQPALGDVTTLVEAAVRVGLGVATLGSFLLALNNYLSEAPETGGPERTIVIQGRDHDIYIDVDMNEEFFESDVETDSEPEERESESQDEDDEQTGSGESAEDT